MTAPAPPEMRRKTLALLRDCRRYIDATRAHWTEANRGEHLERLGRDLVSRIDAQLEEGE